MRVFRLQNFTGTGERFRCLGMQISLAQILIKHTTHKIVRTGIHQTYAQCGIHIQDIHKAQFLHLQCSRAFLRPNNRAAQKQTQHKYGEKHFSSHSFSSFFYAKV